LLAALGLASSITLADGAKDIPVKHFIYIIQENITFDHYFGTYPGADGIPKDVKLSYVPGGEQIYTPFHLHSTAIPHDLNHSWQAAHVAPETDRGSLRAGAAGGPGPGGQRHAGLLQFSAATECGRSADAGDETHVLMRAACWGWPNSAPASRAALCRFSSPAMR
jgi:hypothetical protein